MALDLIKKYGGIIGKGLMGMAAPSIIKGALNETLHGVTVQQASEWVEQDKSLWGNASTDYQIQLKTLRLRLNFGRLDWLTTEWAIEAVRTEHKALASLFMGWPDANKWLERQLETIKKEILS